MIVEGEWGWIEEINMTYVVVRIWDLRRMVLPLSYFLEHPFQNWTKKNGQSVGVSLSLRRLHGAGGRGQEGTGAPCQNH
ncbi:MAG TPA: hypothetical protein VFL54_04800 [Gammaproteobacteria bacterium]|nr:hypothetical protein [Gammaproteobacteria bacterium]